MILFGLWGVPVPTPLSVMDTLDDARRITHQALVVFPPGVLSDCPVAGLRTRITTYDSRDDGLTLRDIFRAMNTTWHRAGTAAFRVCAADFATGDLVVASADQPTTSLRHSRSGN